MAMYPSFNKPEFSQLFEAYPKAILSLMGGAGIANMFSPEGFVSVEFLQLWGISIGAGFLMAAATAIVAKEVDGRTMDLILSQPVNRIEYLTARLAADLTMMVTIVVITGTSLYLGNKMFDIPLKTSGIVAAMVLLAGFYFMIECFCVFAGSVMERGKAIVTAVAVLIGSHLLNGLADLNETIRGYQWLSVFKYYKPGEALLSGNTPWQQVILFLSIGAIFLIAAVVVFREKDIPS
jgi:ABC-2 type transport system permease protein